MVTYFAPTFYATIMIALFIHNLTKVWFRHIWPEIRVPPGESRELQDKLDLDRFTHLHPHLMSLDELCDHVNYYRKSCDHNWQQLFDLRRNRPILFCFLVCSIFTCTATIGNFISGLSLIFATLTAIIILPGVYLYLIPENLKTYLACQLVLLLKLTLHFEDVASLDDDEDDDAVINRAEDTDDESKELISFEKQEVSKSSPIVIPTATRSSMVSRLTGLLYGHHNQIDANQPKRANKSTEHDDTDVSTAQAADDVDQIAYPKLSADLQSKHYLAEFANETILQPEDEEDCEGFVIL